jgi:ribosomal protein S6--L-glutamate ligase
MGWHVQDLLRAAAEVGVDAEVLSLRRLACQYSPSFLAWTTPLPEPPRQAARMMAPGREFTPGPSGQCRVLAREGRGSWDCLIVRVLPAGSLEQIVHRMDVLGALESVGVRVVNPPKSLETAVDKALSSFRLLQAGLPVPPTVACEHTDEAMESFFRLGGDVVVKPLFGSEGRGILRVRDPDEALRIFRVLEEVKCVLYLQPYLSSPGYDVRVLVLGSRPLAAIRRRHPNDWRHNVSRGAEALPHGLSPEEAELACRASACVGAVFAGVDLLPQPGRSPLVLEVNAVPGWRGLRQATGLDVARELLRFLSWHASSASPTDP